MKSLLSLFDRATRKRRRRLAARRSRRGSFETLEARRLLICGTIDVPGAPNTGTIVANDAANAIAYLVGEQSGTAAVSNLVSAQVSSDGVCTEFANRTSVTIEGRAGQDQILLNNATTPTTNAPGFLTALTVDGGQEFDELTVTNVNTNAAIEVTSTQVLNAQGTAANSVPVTYRNIESLVIDGLTGNHNLQQTLSAAATEAVITPAVALDGGVITSNALVPLTYRNVGTGGSVHLSAAAAANDRLTVRAGDSNDTFTVTSTAANVGNIAWTSSGATRTPLQTTSMSHLRIEGGDGDDVFTLTSTATNNLPYTSITISGGDPSASDTVTLNASGAAGVTVAFNDSNSVTISGGGLGSVTLDSVEIITLNAGTNPITVNGSTSADAFNATFIDGDTIRFEEGATGPTLLATSSAAITLAEGTASDGDTLSVFLTPAGETVTVNNSTATGQVAVTAGATLKALAFTSANIESLRVIGGAGTDVFNVTGGAQPISIDGGDPIGGSPSDQLNVTAGATAATVSAGPEKDEGSVQVGTTNPAITFANVETVNVAGTGGATINGTNDDDVITIVAVDNPTHTGTDGAQDFTATVNDGTEILFQNQATLRINALAGSDDVVLRIPAPTGTNAWDVDVTVDGGAPSADGDKVIVEGVGATTATYTPSLATNQIAIAATSRFGTAANRSNITLTSIQTLIYDGEDGGDTLSIVGSASADTIVHTPGDSIDAGQLQIGTSLALNYQNIGAGTLTADGGGNNDTLVYLGTDADDAFTVSNTGVVDLQHSSLNRLDVTPANIEALTLEALDGRDTFTLTGAAIFGQGVEIKGGGSSDDRLTINDANPTLDLSNGQLTNVLSGAATVTVSGVETVDLDGANAVADVFTVTNYGSPSDIQLLTLDGGDTDATPNDGDMINLSLINATNTLEFSSHSLSAASIARREGGPGIEVTRFNHVVPGTGANLSVTGGSGQDTLVIPENSRSDTIGLIRDATNNEYRITTGTGATSTTVPIGFGNANFEALRVAGGGGNDALAINTTGGLISLADGIVFDGGVGGSDVLRVSGSTPSNVTYTPGPDNHSGIVAHGTTQTVTFTGLEPVQIQGTGAADTLTVNGNGANNAISYGVGPNSATGFFGANVSAIVAVDALETMEFSNYGTLVLAGNDGNDTFHLNHGATPTALSGITVRGGNATVDGSVEDRLSVTDRQGGALTVALATGTIAAAEPITVTYTGIEGIRATSGTGGGTNVAVTGSANYTVNPGSTADNTTIVTDTITIELDGYAAGSAFTLTGAGAANNTLTVNGTDGNDTIAMAAADGDISRNGRATIDPAGLTRLFLRTQDGADTVTLNVNTALFTSGVVVDGGSTDSDRVVVTGSAAADTIGLALGATADTLTGVVSTTGNNVVTLRSIETLSATAGGGAGDALSVTGFGSPSALREVTVDASTDATDTFSITGTAEANTITLEPVSATSVTATTAVGPRVTATLNAAAGSTFTASGGTGTDEIIVKTTSGADTIAVTRAATSTVTVTGFKPLTLPDDSPDTLTIESGDGNDTVTVTGTAGADLTVDTGPGTGDQLTLPTTAGVTTIDPSGPRSGRLIGPTGGATASSDDVTFVDAEIVTVTATAATDSLVLNGDGESDTFTVARVATNNEAIVSDGPIVRFATFGNLTLVGQGGDDSFSIEPVGLAGVTTILANGGGPSPGNVAAGEDSLIVRGSTAANTVAISPGASPASIAITGAPTVTFATVDSVVYDGVAGNDPLTFNGTAGDDIAVVRAGDRTDAGTVQVNNFIPVAFRDIDAGSVTFSSAGQATAAGDRLVYEATANADRMAVATTTGAITLTSNAGQHVVVQRTDVEHLTLSGGAGDDTLVIPSGHGWTSIIADGGEPSSGSDTVIATGNAGSAAVVTLGNATPQVPGSGVGTLPQITGAGLGTVSLVGVEHAEVNNAAGAIELAGTAGPDTFHVTPTEANRAVARVNDVSPLVLTNNTGALTVTATGGGTDTLVVQLPDDDDAVTITATGVTTPLKDVAYTGANVDALQVLGGDGSDNFTITPSTTTSILVDGGAPNGAQVGDRITLTAGAATTFTPGADADEGTFAVTGNQLVTFEHIDSFVNVAGAAGLTINATNADNDITVTGTAAATFSYSIDGGPTIPNSGFTSVVINALAGDDDIDIEWNDLTLTGGITAHGNTATATNGGGGSDTVTIRGGTGADTAQWTPGATATTGTLVVAGRTTTVTTLEEIIYDGESDGEILNINSTGTNNDVFTHTPATDGDAGTIAIQEGNVSQLGISYVNLGLGGRLIVNAGGGLTDQFVQRGTAGSDAFTVSNTAMISVAGRVNVTTSGVEGYTLRGEGGDDSFSVTAQPGIIVSVQGDEPGSGSDVLTFNAVGATTVDFEDAQGRTVIQDAAATTTASPDVIFSGIENVIVDANSQNLSIDTSDSDDDIVVTPLGATAGTVAVAGHAAVSFTEASAFDVDAMAGNDRLTVLGSADDDTFTISATAVVMTTPAREAVNYANAEHLVVVGSGGGDDFNVTTGAVETTVVGGGQAGDRLDVTVANAARVTQAAVPTSGLVDQTGNQNLNYLEIATLTIDSGDADASGNDTLTVRATDDEDTIAIGPTGTANEARLWINDGTVITGTVGGASNFANLNVHGRFGDDTFSITPINGIPIIAQGMDPSSSDIAVINGTSAQDTIDFTPDSAGAGATDQATIQVNSLGLVTLQTMEQVTINGLGGNDTLDVNTPAGTDSTIQVTPGATVDAGDVQVDSLMPLQFARLGRTGRVTLTDGGDATIGDTLVYNGTTASDSFTVPGSSAGGDADSIRLNNQLLVQGIADGVETYRLRGLGGNDTFNLSAQANITLAVEGDDSGDIVNFTASGNTTIDVGNSNINDASAAPAPNVVYSGIDVINTTLTTHDLTVLGTARDDDAVVTVLNANSGVVRVNDTAPTVHYTTTDGDPLTIDLGDATDQDTLVVIGDSLEQTLDINASDVVVALPVSGSVPARNVAARTVSVRDAAGAVAGSVTWPADAIESLAVHGLESRDVFNVTPRPFTTAPRVPVFVDGGDPIGKATGDRLNVNGQNTAVTFEGGPETDEGSFIVTSHERISFDHIEELGVTAKKAVVIGTNDDDDFSVIARTEQAAPSKYVGADGVQDFTTSLNEYPEILWLNITEGAYLDGLNGDDDFTIRAAAPNAANWNVNVHVAGGPPSAPEMPESGDRLRVETPGKNDTANYAPTGPDTGILTMATVSSTIFIGPWTLDCDPTTAPNPEIVSSPGGVEHLVYDGATLEGGFVSVPVNQTTPTTPTLFSDTLTVTTPVGADSILYTPGSTIDAGAVQVGSFLPLRFAHLGTGSVTLADTGGGRVDSLTYEGTETNDRFQVAATTGQVTLNAQLPVNTVGVTSITLSGQDGDDLYDVAAPNPFAGGMRLFGGGSSISGDVANLTTTGAADTVATNVTSGTVTGLGGGAGLGTITLNGTEVLNLRTGGGSAADQYIVNSFGADSGIQSINLTANSTLATANEVQQINVGGNTAGTIQLTFMRQTTTEINLASGTLAADIQAALQALSSIGSGNVTVAAAGAGLFSVTFSGALANTNVANITIAQGGTPVTPAGSGVLAITSSTARDTLTVNSTSSDDRIDVQPLGATEGRLQANDAVPTLDFTSLNELQIQGGDGSDIMTVTGSAGQDVVDVTQTTVSVISTDIVTGTTEQRVVVNYNQPTDLEALTVRGLEGTDQFTVTPSAQVPFFIDGGDPIGVGLQETSQEDKLIVEHFGQNVNFNAGPESDEGSVVITNPQTGTGQPTFLQPVSFENIESGTVDPTAGNNIGTASVTQGTLTIESTVGEDVITVVGDSTNETVVAVNNGAKVDFNGFTVVDVDGDLGSDEISITPFYGGTGWDVTINVSGGLPTAGSDTLIVNGAPGATTVEYQPTESGSAVLLLDNGAAGANTGTTINISTVEDVVYNGQNTDTNAADVRQLTVTTTAGRNRVTLTPGDSADSGMVVVDSTLPLAFQDLGVSATATTEQLLIADTGGGRTDELVYLGTGHRDSFLIAGGTGATGGRVSLNEQLTVSTPGVDILTVQGQEGDDDIIVVGAAAGAVTGASTFEQIRVNGGSPGAGSDSLQLIGAGGVTENVSVVVKGLPGDGVIGVDSGDQTVTGMGAPIDVVGMELISLVGQAADTDTLTINPGRGDDRVRVERGSTVDSDPAAATETLVDADRVTSSSLPRIEFSGLDTVTIDGTAGGADEVTFATWSLIGATAANYRFVADAAGLDTLVIDGLDGAVLDAGDLRNDLFTLTNPAAGSVAVTDARGSAVTVTETSGTLGRLQLNTLGGDDTVRVNVQGTAPISVPITYDGGLGSDILQVTGAPSTAVNTQTYRPGPAVDEGRLTYDANAVATDGVLMTIDFDNLEPVHDNVVATTLVVDGTHADNAINYTNGPGGGIFTGATGLISVDGHETIEFNNKANFSLNGLAGDDVINLNAATTPAALTGTITVNGDDSSGSAVATANDVLIVHGTTAVNSIGFLPTAADTGTITGAQGVDVAFDTVESVRINGLGGNDTLTVTTPAGANTVRYTPADTVDGGDVAVDSLVPATFFNLGQTGTLTFADPGGRTDTLVHRGSRANDTFAVAATGNVTLDNSPGMHVPVTTPGVSILTLDGEDGADTFGVTAAHPFTSIRASGGGSDLGDVLNLDDVAGRNATIAVDLAASTVAGFGSAAGEMVHFDGLERVTMSGVDGTDTLTINATAVDDRVTYTPTGPQAGRFVADQHNSTFVFDTVAGAVTANLLGDVGDEVTIVGTNNGDTITVDSPARTLSVETAAGTVLKPVVLGATVEIATARGAGGSDTFAVVPAPPTATGVSGGQAPAVKPINLQINVDGGDSGTDSLVLAADSAGTALVNATHFVMINHSHQHDEGLVRIFRDTAGASNAPTQLPDVNFVDIEHVAPLLSGVTPTSRPNLVILGPDVYEENEFLGTAAMLGSGEQLNVHNLSIFPTSPEVRFAPADQDWFRVIATQNGTLDVQAYFQQYSAEVLPGGGDLQLEVYDVAGTLISGFGTNESAVTDRDERVRIPAVAGQTYFVRVVGAADTVVNGYDLVVVNEPTPTPFDIELDDLTRDNTYDCEASPPSSINSDTGRSHFDDITCDAQPTIVFRLDDALFLRDVQGNDGVTLGNNPPDENIPIPFNASLDPANTTAGYRVAVFIEGSPQQPAPTPIHEPQVPVGFAQQHPGPDGTLGNADDPEGVYIFDFGTANNGAGVTLEDGSHFISTRVQVIDPSATTQTGWGQRSDSLEVIIDTVDPPVFFGLQSEATDGLHPDSDTGNPLMEETFSDRVTRDRTPTFWGLAEADVHVRLFVDMNGNNTIEPATDVLIGQATAVPLDGNNQFGNLTGDHPNGQWQATSTVNLNDPARGFPKDGLRRILIDAQDVAGNVGGPQVLDIFLDTQGPRIFDPAGPEPAVFITAFPSYDVFDPKPLVNGPTPLAPQITINVEDLPVRQPGVPAAFLVPALKTPTVTVNPATGALVDGDANPATPDGTSPLEPDYFEVRGDFNGIIPIRAATFQSDVVTDGSVATGEIILTFFEPLPDDRYTLVIRDSITDHPGNALDGEMDTQEPESSATLEFPSGDLLPGDDFNARFTIDSRPELGMWSAGIAWIDTNGNNDFDPGNLDFTNRDIVYPFGNGGGSGLRADDKAFTSDDFFAGNFSAPGGTADGFDKLGVYGGIGVGLTGPWRFLIDTDNDGVPDEIHQQTLANTSLNGVPVAIDVDDSEKNPDGVPWTGDEVRGNGDEIAIFTGTEWYFDLDHDFQLDAASRLTSDLRGLPIVGDFDGDGLDDLGAYADDRFQFDLSSVGGGGPIPSLPGLDGAIDATINFDFIGIRERPLATDMDQDGIDDIGLWTTDRSGIAPGEGAEWYFLVSNDRDPTDGINDRVTGTVNTLAHAFKPVPFGHDLYAQLGDDFATPIVGNFDPPTTVEVASIPTQLDQRDPLDIDGDGLVVPLDVLVLLNAMATSGSRATGISQAEQTLDPNQDGLLTALDVLLVVNRINGFDGQGEGEGVVVDIVEDLPHLPVATSLDAARSAGHDEAAATFDLGRESAFEAAFATLPRLAGPIDADGESAERKDGWTSSDRENSAELLDAVDQFFAEI